MAADAGLARIKKLAIWQGEIDIAPLTGGLTNLNYLVHDASKAFVVRLGHDLLQHRVLRSTSWRRAGPPTPRGCHLRLSIVKTG